jgi:hypothetical protein
VAAGALAVAILLGGGGGDNDPEPGPLELAVGFNNNAVTDGLATAEQSAQLVAAVGGEVDRVQISWAAIEPRPGEYDFSVYDEIYEADLRQGVRPLFIFAFAPPWAVAEDAPCDASLSNCHLPPAPEHYDAAARTAAGIAERYPKAAGIEIWNEPNSGYFWAPQADPVAYADLLAATSAAIEGVDPGMPVAGGSTASGEGPGKMLDVDFVRAVLEAGGGESMDALSAHAYIAPADASGVSALATIERIAAVQRELGDAAPIWVTETGVSATGPGAPTEAEQAAALKQLAARFDTVEGVEMVLVHTLIRRPTAPEDPEGGFGVLGPDLAPTESYCALSEAWGGTACQSP